MSCLFYGKKRNSNYKIEGVLLYEICFGQETRKIIGGNSGILLNRHNRYEVVNPIKSYPNPFVIEWIKLIFYNFADGLGRLCPKNILGIKRSVMLIL